MGENVIGEGNASVSFRTALFKTLDSGAGL